MLVAALSLADVGDGELDHLPVGEAPSVTVIWSPASTPTAWSVLDQKPLTERSETTP
jgi:hypothetical protein